MFGIDVELGDYHIGSPDMEYDNQTGHHKACACEKDPAGTGYSADKCRVVFSTWDDYGMALYVGNEVGEKGLITQPGFKSTNGMLYLFDSSDQQQEEQSNANGNVKFDAVYGAYVVSDDENEGVVDYDLEKLPVHSSVTIFKTVTEVPYVNGEGSPSNVEEIRNEKPSSTVADEEGKAAGVEHVASTGQADLVQGKSAEIQVPARDENAVTEQPKEVVEKKPEDVPAADGKAATMPQEELSAQVEDRVLDSGKPKENLDNSGEGLQPVTESVSAVPEADAGEREEVHSPKLTEETNQVGIADPGTLAGQGREEPEGSLEREKVGQQPSVEPEVVPEPASVNQELATKVEEEHTAKNEDSGVSAVPEADAGEREEVHSPKLTEETNQVGIADPGTLAGQGREEPEGSLEREKVGQQPSVEPEVVPEPASVNQELAPKVEEEHAAKNEDSGADGDEESKKEEGQKQQDPESPQSRPEDGLSGSRGNDSVWSLFGDIF